MTFPTAKLKVDLPHLKSEPFENQILNHLDFKWVRNLNVWYSSPFCTQKVSEGIIIPCKMKASWAVENYSVFYVYHLLMSLKGLYIEG